MAPYDNSYKLLSQIREKQKMNDLGGGIIPPDYLDDLCSRFIINIPEDNRTDPIRLFFQIEQAYWFYLDFYKAENARLKNCGLKEFSKLILRHIPSYGDLLKNIDRHYDDWRSYKISVPTYGAIILTEDLTKVLLVQSFFEKTSWGFPKGKVNEAEPPLNCAIREVFEETGCDVTPYIKPNMYLEAFVNEQRVRLYVVPGVKESTVFEPQTRNEIRKIQWFNVNDLPTYKKDANQAQTFKPNGFFMVIPFVRKLKNWIEHRKATEADQIKKRRYKSVGDAAYVPHDTSLHKNNYRQEFASPTKLQKNSSTVSNVGDKKHSTQFLVPCWLSFRFDRKALLQCFE